MFGNYLKELQQQAGLTKQERLAERIGVKGPTVSRWMAGVHPPQPEECRKIAAAFGRPQMDRQRETDTPT